MSAVELKTFRQILKDFNEDSRFNLFESGEAEQVYIRNTIAEENLDFSQEEIDQSKTDLLKYLNAERILGSHIYYGILIGLIGAGVTLYFLSLAIPIAALIGVGIGIVLICTILGFIFKKRVRKFQVKMFEKRIIRSFLKWTGKKLDHHKEDVNKRRIVIENFISRFSYIQTLHIKMQPFLENYFIRKFNMLYRQNKIPLYLSLKMLNVVSEELKNNYEYVFQKYRTFILNPLLLIAQNRSTVVDPEFREILNKIRESLSDQIENNPFQSTEAKPNAQPEDLIVVTKSFYISKHQDQFFDLINIWNIPGLDFNTSMISFKSMLKIQNEQNNNNKLVQLANSHVFDDSLIENSKIRILEKLSESVLKGDVSISHTVSNEQNFILPREVNSNLKTSKKHSKKKMKIEKIAIEVDPLIDRLVVIANEDVSHYQKVFGNDKISVMKKLSSDNPVVLVKTSFELDCPAQTIFTLIYDLNWRSKWDDVLSRFRIVDTICPGTDIMYTFFKSPMGVSHRDFLQKRTLIHDYKGAHSVIVFTNITHPKCPPVKDAVRAETIISGYYIKDLKEGGCCVTCISQTDIKGVVPKWIVNYAASKAPLAWLKRLEYGITIFKPQI
jgi:hypothetical protein